MRARQLGMRMALSMGIFATMLASTSAAFASMPALDTSSSHQVLRAGSPVVTWPTDYEQGYKHGYKDGFADGKGACDTNRSARKNPPNSTEQGYVDGYQDGFDTALAQCDD